MSVLVLALALLYAPTLWAADDVSISITPAERAWLAQHPTIVVGGEVDWAPFDFVDESGRHAGISEHKPGSGLAPCPGSLRRQMATWRKGCGN
jgi:hypothetical protein